MEILRCRSGQFDGVVVVVVVCVWGGGEGEVDFCSTSKQRKNSCTISSISCTTFPLEKVPALFISEGKH